MHRDIKEIVGVIMRVLGGGGISRAEVMDLSFDAEGDLLDALNEGYIELLEFAHDREEHGNDEAYLKARGRLQDCLDKIISACDRLPGETGFADELRGIRASYK